jgi:hypothetical protein
MDEKTQNFYKGMAAIGNLLMLIGFLIFCFLCIAVSV